jgi:hypothetical protein
VELTFKTKSYKSKLNKSATIFSNDLGKSQTRIYVSAKVDTIPDATLPISWDPRKITFTQEDKDYDVVFKNRGKTTLNLGTTGDIPGDLAMDGKNGSLKPGEELKLKFKWNGGFQKENYERSVTFVAGDKSETRFSIPFVVEGTDPTPEKAPIKKPRAGKSRTPSVKKAGAKPKIEKSAEDSESK